MSAPTIGRVVLYTLSAADAQAINKRRRDAADSGVIGQNIGAQVHAGNVVHEGEEYPLIVTRVWTGSSVNGQVLLDGNDTYWAASRCEGEGPFRWRWPVRS